MKPKRLLIAVVALLAIGTGWYLFRPERLFVNQRVNEPLMGSDAAASPAAMMPSETAGMMESATPERSPARAIESGSFHSVSHETRGTATVYALDGGARVLRFTEFKTSNGPDVQVYLVAADDAKDNATVTKAGYIRLDALKGNEGDQNYPIPANVDLAKYRAVSIWCRRFAVNFATAPLKPVS